MRHDDRPLVFFDADVLIAGAASNTGASHLLLRLSELGFIQGLTCVQVVQEAERNLLRKLPSALPAFRAILTAAEITLLPSVEGKLLDQLQGLAHQDDLPILAAAIKAGSHYLATFNVRHYHVSKDDIRIVQPGDIVIRLRRALSELR